MIRLFTKPNSQTKATSSSNQCTADGHKCGAIDPVNNPSYNMQNVVKQSILLEEHIAESNKYCISCIVKHFQHIIGLVEEAEWMAGTEVHKYPELGGSASYYESLFRKWQKNQQNDKFKLEVLNALREKRRTLIDIYFLK